MISPNSRRYIHKIIRSVQIISYHQAHTITIVINPVSIANTANLTSSLFPKLLTSLVSVKGALSGLVFFEDDALDVLLPLSSPLELVSCAATLVPDTVSVIVVTPPARLELSLARAVAVVVSVYVDVLMTVLPAESVVVSVLKPRTLVVVLV
jgi:hypothetical protein